MVVGAGVVVVLYVVFYLMCVENIKHPVNSEKAKTGSGDRLYQTQPIFHPISMIYLHCWTILRIFCIMSEFLFLI